MTRPSKKVAAVYKVLGEDGQPRYVGISRDVHGSLGKHLASQEPSDCATAEIKVFGRPSRDAMSKLQERWVSSCERSPPGNSDLPNSWSAPPLTESEANKKLLLRQASADDTLREEDPEAWSKVVRKSMKGGDDFDGSSDDMLEAAIDSDERRTASLKRAAGDWQDEIASQHSTQSKQHVQVEMYSTASCPHCERMRKGLKERGLDFREFDIEVDDSLTALLPEEQLRRFRHAQVRGWRAFCRLK